MANAADTALAFARAQIGKPYVFGTTGPATYDCSGLAMASYRAAGITISRTTYTQVFDGTEVSRNDLRLGDLVFPDPGHVQIYAGNNHVVEAPHSGAKVQEVPMWGFWRARRIVAGGGQGGSPILTGGTVPVSTPLSTGADILSAGQKLFQNVLNPRLWERFGYLAIGVVLLLIGAYLLIGSDAPMGKQAAKVVTTIKEQSNGQ